MSDVNVDMIAGGKSQGDVASKLATMDPSQLRPYVGMDGKAYVTVFKGGDAKDPKNYESMQVNNATLRRDEWKHLDEAVIGVARTRLKGVADLESRGLVYNLGNAMGTTVLEHHSVGEALTAELTMDGVTRAENDRVNFNTHYLPIPIIHADYEINSRVLAASRNMGNALDTTMAERAARRVAEMVENMLFTNTTYAFGGGTIYSYLNHPAAVTDNSMTAWNASPISGSDIVDTVLSMKQDSIDNRYYGPSWVLYVPTAYETVLDQDYDDTTPGTTIRERILKIDGIDSVKVIDTLAPNTVVLVQMTPDVVRLVKGMEIQNVQWQTEGNFITKYKVMSIQVPQIRADDSGRTGIVVYTAQ